MACIGFRVWGGEAWVRPLRIIIGVAISERLILELCEPAVSAVDVVPGPQVDRLMQVMTAVDGVEIFDLNQAMDRWDAFIGRDTDVSGRDEDSLGIEELHFDAAFEVVLLDDERARGFEFQFPLWPAAVRPPGCVGGQGVFEDDSFGMFSPQSFVERAFCLRGCGGGDELDSAMRGRLDQWG